jgi:2-polyprenyl-6-methoxyphenol hydroxylase-like FAD-dependent oxidoreductase
VTAPSALIAGAGVGGLASAWWLARIGWRVTVVERARDLRANGYMLGLSGPGYEVARRMGILPDLLAWHREIRENVYRGRDGRELLRLRYRDFLRGLEWATLARTELVKVLYRAAQGVADIHFGTTITDHRAEGDGVVATLGDGSERRVDLLIGADGVHSAVRGRAFGAEDRFAKQMGYRVAAFQLPDTLGLGEDFLSYAEPGRLAEFYTQGEGRLATLYIWRAVDPAPVAVDNRRAALRQAFAGAHPDALRPVDDLPDDEPLYFDEMTLIEMPRWSQGRVLLLGDAAHCLTLLSGQGAGIAMTSACILAEELAKDDIDAALARHEARVRPVAKRLQDRSRRIAQWFVPATPMAFRLHTFMLRHSPRRLLGWYFSRNMRSEILAASDQMAAFRERRLPAGS